jgi:hypothetical protein
VRLTPWFANEPWRTAALGTGRELIGPTTKHTGLTGPKGPELGL